MTPAKLRVLIEAGTPEPWYHGIDTDNWRSHENWHVPVAGYKNPHVAATHTEPDAALIVALRNLAPQLLALWGAAERMRSGPEGSPTFWKAVNDVRAALADLEAQE